MKLSGERFTQIAAGLTVGLILLAFLPTFHAYYAHADDYFWGAWGNQSCTDQFAFMGLTGRPLSAFPHCLQFFVGKVADLNYFRLLSALNLSLLAFLIFRWVASWKYDVILSFCLGVMVVTLPPFQTYVAYATIAACGFSSTLAMFALFLARQASESADVREAWKRGLLSITSLIVAMSFYQPGALIFAAMLAVPVLSARSEGFFAEWRRPVLIYGCILLVSAITYYVLWRLGVVLSGLSVSGKYSGSDFVQDYSGRIRWFIEYPLLETLNFWSLDASRSVAIGIGLLILLLPAFEFANALKAGTARPGLGDLLAKYLLVFGLIPTSYIINLLSSNPSPEYRTYSALAVSVTMTVVLGVYRILSNPEGVFKVPRGALALSCAAFMGFGIFKANATISEYFVNPGSDELKYLKNRIGSYIEEQRELSWIHVVAPYEASAVANRRHDFGLSSLAHGPNIRPVIIAALNELGHFISVPVSLSFPQDPNTWLQWSGVMRGTDMDIRQVERRTDSPGLLIIDMTQRSFH